MDQGTIGPEVIEIVEFFMERLNESGVRVCKLVLFGSHSAGAAGPGSDIDIIIISEDFRNKTLFERASMIGQAYDATVSKYLVPMDLVMETPEQFNPDFGVVVFAA